MDDDLPVADVARTMTPLQILIICIWVFLGFAALYTLGEQLDGGFRLIGGALTVIAVYGGFGALLYYTGKAIFGY